MKREGFNHAKVKLLARDLAIPLPYAHGILDRLWILTALSFPRGDIGRQTNEEIAISIDYPGDADQLIQVLINRRLLDVIPDSEGRLYVHDWHEHSDDTVSWKLARSGQSFANGVPPRRAKSVNKAEKQEPVRHSLTQSDTDGLPSSSPSSSSTPSPSPSSSSMPTSSKEELHIEAAEQPAASDPTSKKKSPKPAKDKPKASAAVEAYREIVKRYPDSALWPMIDEAVGEDVGRWREVVLHYVACGWNKQNVSNMLAFFKDRKLPSNANGKQAIASTSREYSQSSEEGTLSMMEACNYNPDDFDFANKPKANAPRLFPDTDPATCKTAQEFAKLVGGTVEKDRKDPKTEHVWHRAQRHSWRWINAAVVDFLGITDEGTLIERMRREQKGEAAQ